MSASKALATRPWAWLVPLLLAPALLAREPGTGRFSGEIRTTDQHRIWNVQVVGAGGRRPGKMLGGGFALKYQYSTMMGEALVYQVGKYHPGTELSIGPGQLRIKEGHVDEPEFERTGDLTFAHVVLVPEGWLRELRVTSFEPHLRFSHGAAAWVDVRDQNVGVLGRPGEWAWDMTGSPDWASVFEAGSWNPKQANMGIWSAVADQHEGHGVHADIRPEAIVVDASALISRIQRHIPEALGALYPARLENQAASLLNALDRALLRATAKDLRSDAGVTALLAAVDRFFAAFAKELPVETTKRWDELRALPQELARAEEALRNIPRTHPSPGDVGLARHLLATYRHLRPYGNQPEVWEGLKRVDQEVARARAAAQARLPPTPSPSPSPPPPSTEPPATSSSPSTRRRQERDPCDPRRASGRRPRYCHRNRVGRFSNVQDLGKAENQKSWGCSLHLRTHGDSSVDLLVNGEEERTRIQAEKKERKYDLDLVVGWNTIEVRARRYQRRRGERHDLNSGSLRVECRGEGSVLSRSWSLESREYQGRGLLTGDALFEGDVPRAVFGLVTYR